MLNSFPVEARAYLEKAIEIDPVNTDARFWLAKSLYHDFCDYEQARSFLYEAVELAPTRADCLALLVYIILDLDGATDEAIKYLNEALQVAPDWTGSRRQLIQIYTWRREFVLAERELKKLETIIENMGKEDVVIHSNIENYYETAVTGRFTIARNIKALKEQIHELNRAKLKLS